MTDQQYTDITFVLDRSGSMAAIKAATEAGFNEFVAEQRGAAGRATMNLMQFDDHYEQVFTGLDPARVRPLNLVPRGTTALLDAIGRTINETGERLAALPEEQRPGTVIIAIMTDGHENASQEFTHPMIKSMIEHQEEVYEWTFLYLGANQDAIEVGAQLGVSADRALTYSGDAADLAFGAMSASMGRMRASRLRGGDIAESRASMAYSSAERASASGAPSKRSRRSKNSPKAT